jgi:predicted SprT family Zn-dependent metalloprotease
MLSELDRQRSRFIPNDSVTFKYRRKVVQGTLIRTNPKRGVVLMDGEEFHVPYELLIPTANSISQREERIEVIHQMALELLSEHGLKKWHFKFDDSTRRAGCCNYRDKIISISFHLAQSGSDEEIRDTILHEIAHALVGRKHNHGEVWKVKAQEIGCSGERTHKLQFLPPRYHVTCEKRCWKHTAERRNSRFICRTCGGKLVYTPYAAPA